MNLLKSVWEKVCDFFSWGEPVATYIERCEGATTSRGRARIFIDEETARQAEAKRLSGVKWIVS